MRKIFEDIFDDIKDEEIVDNHTDDLQNKEILSNYAHCFTFDTVIVPPSILKSNPKPIKRLLYMLGQSDMFSDYVLHFDCTSSKKDQRDGIYNESKAEVFNPNNGMSINNWCDSVFEKLNSDKSGDLRTYNIYFNIGKTPSLSKFTCTFIDFAKLISMAHGNQTAYNKLGFRWTLIGTKIDGLSILSDNQYQSVWNMLDPSNLCKYCDEYYESWKLSTGAYRVSEADIDRIFDKYDSIYKVDRVLLKNHFHLYPLKNGTWIKSFTHSGNGHCVELDNWEQLSAGSGMRIVSVPWTNIFGILSQEPSSMFTYRWTVKTTKGVLLNVIFDDINDMKSQEKCYISFTNLANALISGVDELKFKYIMNYKVTADVTEVYIDNISDINDGQTHEFDPREWIAYDYYAYERDDGTINYSVTKKKSRSKKKKYNTIIIQNVNSEIKPLPLLESSETGTGIDDYIDLDPETEEIRQKTRDFIRTIEIDRPEGWWTKPRTQANGKTVIPLESIENDLYHFYFASSSFYTNEFEPGIARIAVGELKFDLSMEFCNEFMKLKKILEIIMTAGDESEKYDEDLNGLTFEELDKKYSYSVEMDRQRMEERINSREYERTPDYEIIQIHSYDEAHEYNELTNPDSPLCVTYSERKFNAYLDNGNNKMFFVLYKDYQDIEKPKLPYEKNSKIAGWVDYLDINSDGIPYMPYDEYGLSMIFLTVNPDGMINWCAGRWNHEIGDFSRDFLDEEQISNLLGVNFYEYFCNDSPVDESKKPVKKNSKRTINESWIPENELTDEEQNLLHGRCEQFALNQAKDGDQFFIIIDYDYDIDSYAMLHCGIYRNGKYIDVRGETENIEDILDGFDWSEEYTVDIVNLEEFKQYLKEQRLI